MSGSKIGHLSCLKHSNVLKLSINLLRNWSYSLPTAHICWTTTTRWRTWNDFAHRNDYRRANIWLVTINSVMHTGTRRKTNDSTQHISSVCLCALIHCNLSTIKLSSDYDECNAISISLLLLLLNNDFNYLSRTPWNASFVIPREHSSFFVCLLTPFCTILFSKRSLHLQFYYSISIFYVYTYSDSIAINHLQYHFYRLYTRTSR